MKPVFELAARLQIDPRIDTINRAVVFDNGPAEPELAERTFAAAA
jgi:hypothetical protein